MSLVNIKVVAKKLSPTQSSPTETNTTDAQSDKNQSDENVVRVAQTPASAEFQILASMINDKILKKRQNELGNPPLKIHKFT